jgi:hypothetical protein
MTDKRLQRVLLSARKRDRIDLGGMAATFGVLAGAALAFVLTWMWRAA